MRPSPLQAQGENRALAAAAAVPLPGVDVAADFGIVSTMLPKINATNAINQYVEERPADRETPVGAAVT